MQNHMNQGPSTQNILQEALRELHSRNPDTGQVGRVAIEGQGVIHIEARVAGKDRFFEYGANGLRELRPEDDLKIPLASRLHDDNSVPDHAIISYRPGRRIVLGPVHGQQGNIIKGYRKRRATQAMERHALAQAACGHGSFDVPELLHHEPDGDYLVMAKRPGKTPEIATDGRDVWAGIGSCLRRFQQSDRKDGLQVFGVPEELAVLDERARRYLLCVPSLPRRWQAGRESLGQAAMNLPSTVTVLAHRDLHDRQFIVAGDAISLLDFDLMCSADVALDAGNLLAHMKLRALQGGREKRADAVSVCGDAFLAGLGRQGEHGFEQSLLFYQASTFYRLALLYALRPRWAHLSDALTDEGKECIDALNSLRGRS